MLFYHKLFEKPWKCNDCNGGELQKFLKYKQNKYIKGILNIFEFPFYF